MKTEHEEQRELVMWFRQEHPGVRIFAIPNGGHRSRTTGAKLKSEGVSAGVPDLYIPAWRCWIEMKREKGGKVSPVQKDWIAYLKGISDTVIIGNGCEDAQNKIRLMCK
jgi:hypothetical protein|tara:strand:+ start:116 stop:442 length:327 start_codon:yes stop_codon:yes gene_type:complete